MHNLFYLKKDQNTIDFKKDVDFDFMDSVEFIWPDGTCENIDMYVFLHGFCDVFAYRLREKYDYDICFNYEDEECTQLIHAYCVCTINDKLYYIDIRGITDDYDEFFKEFEDWDWYGYTDSLLFWFKDESKRILNRKGKFSKQHKIIDKIFDYFKDHYDINKFLIKERNCRKYA